MGLTSRKSKMTPNGSQLEAFWKVQVALQQQGYRITDTFIEEIKDTPDGYLYIIARIQPESQDFIKVCIDPYGNVER